MAYPYDIYNLNPGNVAPLDLTQQQLELIRRQQAMAPFAAYTRATLPAQSRYTFEGIAPDAAVPDIQYGDLSSAPSGSRYINQTLSDQYLRSATGNAPLERMSEPPLKTMEQGAAPRRTLGLLGDMFGGASALDEYMTDAQRAQLQNQGVMAAAMQLLASSGPSRVPVGLGQALGQAYGAGQQGYTAAQQNLLTSMTVKQRMEDAKAAKNMQTTVSTFLAQPAPEGVDANTFKAQQYMKLADIYAARNPEQASKFFDMAQKLMPTADKPVGEPFKASDGKYYQRTESGGVKLFGGGTVTPADKPVGDPFKAADGKFYQRTESGGTVLFSEGTVMPAAKPMGQPQQQLVDGKVQMVQYYDDGTFKPIAGVSQVAKPTGQPQMRVVNGVPTMMQDYDDGTSKPLAGVSQYNAPSTAVTDVEFLTGKSLAGTGATGVAKVQDYKKSGAVSVSLSTGKEGFKNEFDLSKEFKNEPVYKDFQGMKGALSAVQASLKKENPIGDVAAATKIMKLLDPGSVVRESELGIAMAASGKLDRISNYVDMWKNGTLLTPTQRAEFGALANELYNASARAYNDKRGEYAAFGAKYQIDANTALGNTAPVLTFTPPAAAGAAGRPPLSSIIKPRGAQ
jgi:hypothetical protein